MKYITLLFALFVCAMVSTAQVVDGINYTFSGSDATVIPLPAPDKYTGDVVIPSTVTYNSVTYNVTVIGVSAFSNCKTLNSVILSNGIQTIENNAFTSCSFLSSISIPEGVTSIGNFAFQGCATLTSVTLPESLESIGGNAFRSCVNITSINLPNSLTTIEVGAFYGCKKLSSIIIPAGVNAIHGVFSGCTALTSIYSLNTTPPELTATSFSGVSKDTLYVMAGSLSAYQGALEWGDFKTIIELRVDVTAPAVCLGSNVDLTSAVNVTPADATVKHFESDKTTPVATPTAVLMNSTTTYYAQMSTIHGYKSAMTPIVVTAIPNPTMTAPANLSVCPGTTSAVDLLPLGTNVTHFTWTGGNSIGLDDDNGSTPKTAIPSFTAVNTGTTPLQATIMITPQNTVNGITCSGTPVAFTVTVNPLPVVTLVTNATNDEGCVNTDITFTTEPGMNAYVWDLGGATTITSGGTPTSNIAVLKWNTSGMKNVSVNYTNSNGCTLTTAVQATISIGTKPDVSPIALPAAICEGNALSLPSPTVTAQGTPVTTQIWKLDGVAYTAGTVLTYTDNGKSLTFTASSACGDSVVTVGNITVYQTTAINTQSSVPAGIKLSNGYIIPGSIVPLSVVAVGHNLTYQWYWKKASDGTTVTLANGGKYSGVTTANLTINNAYETENGDYYVTVTGTCNAVTSTPVTIVAVANQDASLKDLKVNGTTLSDFNPGKTDYILAIACDDEQATILGTPNFTGITSITGNGTFALQPGDNYFPITVVAQDMVTTMTYTVNVVRNCYVPKIKKDLDDAVICLNGSHSWVIDVEGENLTYEWYKGDTRIVGANTNKLTIAEAQFSDYDSYYVIIQSNHNGFKSSIQSKKVRLWVADYLPEHLKFAEYPNPATVGNTHHLKVDGYVDVTKYSWSYSKDGVTFSPAVTLYNDNETWATFGTLSAGTGVLKVMMEHPCGTRELTQTITVNYPTGVEDVTATVVTVYPNPTSGILKVSGTVANQMIKVTDVTGSLKGSYKTQEGATTIDLSSYAKGTYLIQYNGKAYKVIRK